MWEQTGSACVALNACFAKNVLNEQGSILSAKAIPNRVTRADTHREKWRLDI